MALLMTCGYPAEKGCDLFEEGMRRYCRHSRLRYLGAHVEQAPGLWNRIYGWREGG